MAISSRLIGRFAANDFKLARRDSFLVMMAGMILVLGLVFRFVLPWADTYLAEAGLLPNQSTNLRFSDLYPMLVGFIGIFQSAVLAGAIFGFLFLNEKDSDTLTVMLVTPVRLGDYLAYRVAMPALATFLISLVIVPLISQSDLAFWKLIALAAGAAPAASLIVLYYALVAENKVQGFAMAKFVALAGWIIPAAWFLPEPWQWLIALFPPFLAQKAFWMADSGASLWWAPLVIGFAWQIVVLAVMARRFCAKVQG